MREIPLTTKHRTLLRQAITEAGGQPTVARAVGVSQPTLSQYLSGLKNPSPTTLKTLARVLDLEWHYIPPQLVLRRVKSKRRG